MFENIHAVNCHVAAAYFEGLPEKKIERMEMRNCFISFAKETKTDVPIMSEGVEACTKRGLYVKNVETLVLENVVIEGAEGEPVTLVDVDRVERPDA